MVNRNKCYVSFFFRRGDIMMLVGYSYIKHVLLIHDYYTFARERYKCVESKRNNSPQSLLRISSMEYIVCLQRLEYCDFNLIESKRHLWIVYNQYEDILSYFKSIISIDSLNLHLNQFQV